MHTYHSYLRFFMSKKDVKLRLICWVLLLQEFDFEVKDKKGTENQVAGYFSRLEDETIIGLGEKAKVDDTFRNKHVLAVSQDIIP